MDDVTSRSDDLYEAVPENLASPNDAPGKPASHVGVPLQTTGKTDGDLLRLFVETRSEEAFRELQRRYVGLVFSTCLREIGDRSLAEDASQSVFLLLSRKAQALQRSESIAGWLYAAARYVAKNLRKQEQRRKMNELQAAAEAEFTANSGASLWSRIEPHLHDALDHLKPADREAVLLRYLAQQSFAEVAGRLGLSENTARMRVSRALDKVRAHFGKLGISISLVLLAALLEDHAVLVPPAALLETVPDTTAGNGAAAASNAPDPVARFDVPRPIAASIRLIVVLGGAAALLAGFLAYPRITSRQLSAEQRRQLFSKLAGNWKGTLEFVDDASLKRYTYPASVLLRAIHQNSDLEIVASYQGSSSVDTTRILTDSLTGHVTLENGGDQSSHRSSGRGELTRWQGSGCAFQGKSLLSNADMRFTIVPINNRLTLQEEYRKPGQKSYQLRNRFDLVKQ